MGVLDEKSIKPGPVMELGALELLIQNHLESDKQEPGSVMFFCFIPIFLHFLLLFKFCVLHKGVFGVTKRQTFIS